jgi:hypothetical protein
VKKSSNGHLRYWRGYKLHLDVTDGHIPISALLTGASVHESQAAIPLMTLSTQRVTCLYDLMDSAYDAAAIRAHSLGARPPAHYRSPAALPQDRRAQSAATQELTFRKMVPELELRAEEMTGPNRIVSALLTGTVAQPSISVAACSFCWPPSPSRSTSHQSHTHTKIRSVKATSPEFCKRVTEVEEKISTFISES